MLGSFVRDRGTKKQRWRHDGSTAGHSSLQEHQTTTPRRAITSRHWGSDADLVGDLGISCAPELSEKGSNNPRPAPIALPSGRHSKNTMNELVQQPSIEGPAQTDEEHGIGATSTDMPAPPKSPSFFDVGGLLGENDRPAVPNQHTVAAPQHCHSSRSVSPLHTDSIAVPQTLRNSIGSDAFLEDVGVLQTSSANRPGPHDRTMSLADILRETESKNAQLRVSPSEQRRNTPPAIADAGGLLSPPQRPSTSDSRYFSLVDVLRETGPDGTKQIPSKLPPDTIERVDSPPDIQDIGGLLSSSQETQSRPMTADGRAVTLIDEPHNAGPSAPNKQQVPPTYDEKNVGFEDIGGLLR